MFIGTTGQHLPAFLSPNGTGLTYSLTSQIPPSLKSLDSSPPPFKPHSQATLKPIIVAQRYSLALRATFKPIIVAQRYSHALPGDTFAHYRCPTVLLGTPGRHFRPLLSPNGAPWHYRATLTPIIVAQRYWPDIFTHFTNPSLTQKPRLFSTSLQAALPGNI